MKVGVSRSERSNIPTPLCKALCHVSTQEHLSFRPVTPRACLSPGSLNTVCCCLTFEEDEGSSFNRDIPHPRMEHHIPDDNTMAHHLTSMEEEDKEEEDTEEHFLTASLNGNVWMEEPVPERHLCIHENSQHDLCPYPCLYSLNQLHLAQNNALQYMDLSDIFEFSNVITAARDEDIPSLEAILEL